MVNRKIAPTASIADALISMDEKREGAVASMTAHYESSSLWLKEEILSCKRKILDGMSEVENFQKKTKNAAAPIDKENSNPNMSKQHEQKMSLKKEKASNGCHSDIDVMSMKVDELRKELRARGLNQFGLKKVLQERLLNAIAISGLTRDESRGEGEAANSIEPQKHINEANTEQRMEPKVEIVSSESDEPTNKSAADDVEMEDASTSSVSMDMEIETDEPKLAPEESAASNTSTDIVPTLKPSAVSVSIGDNPEAGTIGAPFVKKKTVAKSILKAAESLFSPKKTFSKPRQIVVGTSLSASAKKKFVNTGSAPVASSNLPYSAVPATNQSGQEPRNLIKFSENSDSDVPRSNANSSVNNNKVQWGSLPSKKEKSSKPISVPALSTPALVLTSKLSGPSSGKSSASSTSTSFSTSSINAKQLAFNKARQTRLAEIRGKSKPVSLSKLNLPPKNLSAASKLVASISNSAGGKEDKRKKLLAAQMREKAAANLKKNVASTVPNCNIKKDTAKAELFKPSPTEPTPKTFTEATGSAKKKRGPSKPEILSPMSTYEISDREDIDSDEDSDYEDQPRKKIPEWAKKGNLYPALERQFAPETTRLDPDTIFHAIHSCDLEAIFGDKKQLKYKQRTSSGNWTKDRVTAAEKLTYKRTMGYGVA